MLTRHRRAIRLSSWRTLMTKEIKQPRIPRDEKLPTRPSHEKVIENVDRWANSPGLQPPT
jgi:hypothetical protein